MRVVYDSRHVLHDPTTEVQYGVPMHMYEVPARVESIRAALLADDEFSFTGPTEHGLGPVTAVHDEGLVRFLGESWTRWRIRRCARAWAQRLSRRQPSGASATGAGRR